MMVWLPCSQYVLWEEDDPPMNWMCIPASIKTKNFPLRFAQFKKRRGKKEIMNISRGAKLFDSTRLRFVKTCLLAGRRPEGPKALRVAFGPQASMLFD